ncbi:MAG: hypothetical protein LUE87_01725 [Lachnospiraceae bacterium]|nr:hypothetical protein [Lachnospiraceae bacterium]
MLPVGRIGGGLAQERASRFTQVEQRTMMTLWCLFGSPLMIGAELTKLDAETYELLINRDILDMLPPSCRPRQIFRDEEKAAWAAYDSERKAAYASLFNLKDEAAQLSVDGGSLMNALVSVGMPRDVSFTGGKELWTGECTEFAMKGLPEEIRASLCAHGCRVWRLEIVCQGETADGRT